MVWINLREEVVLECDGYIHSLWPPGPTLAPEQLEVGFLAFHIVRMGGTWERRGMREREPEGCTPLVWMEEWGPEQMIRAAAGPGLLFPCFHVPILLWLFCLWGGSALRLAR